MENGPPFKSEAIPPSFHHFADHHFAIQSPPHDAASWLRASAW